MGNRQKNLYTYLDTPGRIIILSNLINSGSLTSCIEQKIESCTEEYRCPK